MVSDWIYEKFLELSDRTAIISDQKEYSYSSFLDRINRYFKILTSQIKQGEVVAIVSDYSIASISVFFALHRNKNIVVPIVSNTGSEISKRLVIACVQKVIEFNGEDVQISNTGSSQENVLINQLRNNKLAGLILFSSGMTGEPKGMVHDLDGLIHSYRKESTKDINSLLLLTFDHIGGIDTLLRLLSIGGTVTIPEKVDPFSICELIERFNINVLPGSPTFLNLIIISEAYKSYDLSSLKIIGYGAEPMPEFLLKMLNEIFPNVKLHQKFGTSETNAIRVINKSNDSLFMRIDDSNIEYKVVDNELWLKSQTQVLGYLNQVEDSFEQGWFKTGDLVEVEEDGFFRIVGRKKEVINVGGEKVNPSEIENVIMQHKDVQECAVYGMPNVITGETVIAEVQISKSSDSLKVKKEIKHLCVERLDKFKCPTKVKIVEEIKVNSRFKKLRKSK